MAKRSSKPKRGPRRRESVPRSAARTVERRQARRRAWKRLGLLLGTLLLLAGGAWGGWAAWRAMFSENVFFEIQQIDVTTDGDLRRGHILEYARVSVGQNLFAVNPQDIRELLLSVPVVAHAQVGRRLPNTLVIELTERVAVARLGRAGSGSPLAVDSLGHVLGPSSVRARLPVVVGIRDKGLRPGDQVEDSMLAEALTVLEVCNQADVRPDLTVTTIDVSNDEQLDVGLATGERVLLSRTGMEKKLRQLCAMREEARRRGLALGVYDMTVERNFVGRPAAWQDPAERP
ncbi:MAG: FtsQ-type POTRA domain-containing protein [Kiritimatiellae bacterium]|nr:FtsQ-type POTRA domain-containing protein [Kiritimatiellia bacterium]